MAHMLHLSFSVQHEVQSQQETINVQSGDRAKEIDAFAEVTPDERSGRVRLAGRGVTHKDVKGKTKVGEIQVPDCFLTSLKVEMKAEVKAEVREEIRTKVTKDVTKAIISMLANIFPQLHDIDIES